MIREIKDDEISHCASVIRQSFQTVAVKVEGGKMV